MGATSPGFRLGALGAAGPQGYAVSMKWIDLPPAWLALFLALGWMQATYLPLVGFPPWLNHAGTVLTVLGIAFLALAAFEFLRHRTTIVPRETPARLIRTGVFRVSRNPIYLADALILAGLSLRWDAILSLALVPVFVVLITRRFIRDEEDRLQSLFGTEFADYAGRVRRWF